MLEKTKERGAASDSASQELENVKVSQEHNKFTDGSLEVTGGTPTRRITIERPPALWTPSMTFNDENAKALRCALTLVHNTGWSVFPISADKRPTIKGGCHAASVDLAGIERMWHICDPIIAFTTDERSGVGVDPKHEISVQLLTATGGPMTALTAGGEA